MKPFPCLPKGQVRFQLQGSLPIFRERYMSPQAGQVVLKGFFNQTAHMELPDGTRYRTQPPRRDDEFADQLAYPVIHLPSRERVFQLRTPIRLGQGSAHQLQFTTVIDNQQYVYKQVSAGKRGFELWDSTEMLKIVARNPGEALISQLTVLEPVPTVLVLLFPWLDNQMIPLKQP